MKTKILLWFTLLDWAISLEFKLPDLWIGAYFANESLMRITPERELVKFHLFICLIPCFPIHLTKLSSRAVTPPIVYKRSN